MSTELVTYDETRTVRVERKFIHKWIIQNYNCPEDNGITPSAKFNFTLDNNYSAQLSITGDSCYSRSCMIRINCEYTAWKLYVTLWLGEQKGDSNTFITSFLSSDIRICPSIQLYHTIRNGKITLRPTCLLPTNNYTIMCEITFAEYKKDTAEPVLFPIQESKLGHDLVELFKTKKYWDITLNVAGHDVHAHKCILASRSKVFEAMFEHDMEEAISNKVSITDIDLEAAEELLRYIYTDEVSNIKEMAFKLLPASDKYDLPKLRSMCENELAKNISIETVAEILSLADLHRSEKLMDHAIGFIKNNNKAVAATKGWTELTNNHPHLLAKVYLKIIN